MKKNIVNKALENIEYTNGGFYIEAKYLLRLFRYIGELEGKQGKPNYIFNKLSRNIKNEPNHSTR